MKQQMGKATAYEGEYRLISWSFQCLRRDLRNDIVFISGVKYSQGIICQNLDIAGGLWAILGKKTAQLCREHAFSLEMRRLNYRGSIKWFINPLQSDTIRFLSGAWCCIVNAIINPEYAAWNFAINYYVPVFIAVIATCSSSLLCVDIGD